MDKTMSQNYVDELICFFSCLAEKLGKTNINYIKYARKFVNDSNYLRRIINISLRRLI